MKKEYNFSSHFLFQTGFILDLDSKILKLGPNNIILIRNNGCLLYRTKFEIRGGNKDLNPVTSGVWNPAFRLAGYLAMEINSKISTYPVLP